jgi:hypothetical protein
MERIPVHRSSLLVLTIALCAACNAPPQPPANPSADAALEKAGVHFPLTMSENGRHLVDRDNKPFLIKEFSAWGLLQAIKEQSRKNADVRGISGPTLQGYAQYHVDRRG